jgi:hypothetical protein
MEDGLYAVRFLVGERALCIWDWNPKKHNDVFIENLDPYYFEYLARTFVATAAEADEQRFSIAVRTAYSQALETFFALAAATMQVPNYVPGWLLHYKQSDLRFVVQSIDSAEPLKNAFRLKPVSWASVARLTNPGLVRTVDDGNSLVDSIAQCWAFFASDFLNEFAISEYNSIKHGFRVRPGGIEIGLAPGHDRLVEDLAFQIKSDFGSGFLSTTRIPGVPRHHRQVKAHHRNWHPQDMLYGLSLLSLSIDNLLQFLRVQNGHEPREQKWPTNLKEFGDPWEFAHTLDAVNATYAAFELTSLDVTPFTKDDITSAYEQDG